MLILLVGAVPAMADNQASDFLHPERFQGWAERYRPQMRHHGFGRALYGAIPTLEYFEIDQAGHLPRMEQPAVFNQRMLAYLEAHPS